MYIYYEAIMIPCHEMRWEKLSDPWRLNNGGTGFHQQGQQQSVRGDHSQPDFNSVQRAALNIKKTEIRRWLATESAQHCGVQQSDTTTISLGWWISLCQANCYPGTSHISVNLSPVLRRLMTLLFSLLLSFTACLQDDIPSNLTRGRNHREKPICTINNL